ncbi:MAG: hypothetical protein ACFE0I_20575 [Elainellaceae cyanobacterium]
MMKYCRSHPRLAGIQHIRRTVCSATSTPSWINAIICLQSIAVEDFEYYAIYESNYFDVLISFMIFKPIEMFCEVAAEAVSAQGRSLLSKMS